MFVPIIAYLHCKYTVCAVYLGICTYGMYRNFIGNDQADHQGRKCGYQIMEYYKDGEILQLTYYPY